MGQFTSPGLSRDLFLRMQLRPVYYTRLVKFYKVYLIIFYFFTGLIPNNDSLFHTLKHIKTLSDPYCINSISPPVSTTLFKYLLCHINFLNMTTIYPMLLFQFTPPASTLITI